VIDLACRKPNSLGMAAKPGALPALAEHVASLDTRRQHMLKGIAEMHALPL
jgi:hypothetical protein